MTEKSHFNNLTPAEAERLFLLLEELGEAQHAIGKVLRHGYESFNPFDDENITNRELLAKELGDVEAAIVMLTSARDIYESSIYNAKNKKLESVKRWLHHQPA